MIGAKYQQFLDNIQAYFYFPLAIAKDGFVSNGIISAEVMPVAGLIDQAGGIAFGIQNIGNYFVVSAEQPRKQPYSLRIREQPPNRASIRVETA